MFLLISSCPYYTGIYQSLVSPMFPLSPSNYRITTEGSTYTNTVQNGRTCILSLNGRYAWHNNCKIDNECISNHTRFDTVFYCLCYNWRNIHIHSICVFAFTLTWTPWHVFIWNTRVWYWFVWLQFTSTVHSHNIALAHFYKR
jgi:hypothetical protein